MTLKRKTNVQVTCSSHRHRYPTRWNLSRHTSASPSHICQTPSIEDGDKDQVLVGCKRRKVGRDILYLPRDLIFNVLLVVSAKVLHEIVRYVCKQWYDIVSDPVFIRAHRQLSPAGFLIQDPKKLHQFYDIEGDRAKLKATEIQLPYPSRVLGSFNGLVLLRDMTNLEIFHVMNPVTKVKLSLPPLAGLNISNKIYGSTAFAVDSSGRYKVVRVRFEEVQMRVFTVGVDKAWRFVDLQVIDMVSKTAFVRHPHVIAGYIYWCGSSRCFAMDVETETIYQFIKPKDAELDCYHVTFVSMGSCLGLVKVRREMCRIWKLTDVKYGKWTEVAGIDLRPMVDRVDKVLYPREGRAFDPISFIDGDIWFYRGVDNEFVLVCYNLATESYVFFPLKMISSDTLLYSHVHTLLSPKNC